MRRAILLRGGLFGTLRLVLRLLFDRRVPLRLKLLLPAAVAYFVSPIDLMPDFFPILGRVDDILALLLALVLLIGLAPREALREHWERISGSGQGRKGPEEGKVIEGSYRYIDGEGQQ